MDRVFYAISSEYLYRDFDIVDNIVAFTYKGFLKDRKKEEND